MCSKKRWWSRIFVRRGSGSWGRVATIIFQMQCCSFQMVFKRFFVEINDEWKMIWSKKFCFVTNRIMVFSIWFFDLASWRIVMIRRVRIDLFNSRCFYFALIIGMKIRILSFAGFFFGCGRIIDWVMCWRSGPFDAAWLRGRLSVEGKGNISMF